MSAAADHLYDFVVVETEARYAALLVDEFLPAWREHGGLRPYKVSLLPGQYTEGVVVEARWCEINDLSGEVKIRVQRHAMTYAEWANLKKGGAALALRDTARYMCEHPDMGHCREDLAEEKP